MANYPHRKSPRLKDYDYSQQGGYFITICTYQRQCIFGDVINGEMPLNDIGEIVDYEWQRGPDIRPEVALDLYAVMPNHLHAIVFITSDTKNESPAERTHRRASLQMPIRTAKLLGSLVAGFKASATWRINHQRGTPSAPVWQARYHDRIIRSETALNAIRQYILNNPAMWDADPDNPGSR